MTFDPTDPEELLEKTSSDVPIAEAMAAGLDEVLQPAAENQNRFDFPADQNRLSQPASSEVRVVTVDEFAAVEEPGAAAILGTPDSALIPEGGDAMVYGDGGVGKTTLMIDLACHLVSKRVQT